MNNKIVSTKKSSAIFLAIVLVAGTFALISPSFMTNAQAFQMDNNYDKKSSGKDVSVKSIKCNNINVNVNGLELTALPSSLSGLLASEAEAADEGQYGASSYGSSGGQSGYDNNSFKFVCINNNNNTVVVGEEPPVPPVVNECEECFGANITLQAVIEDFLVDRTDHLIASFGEEILDIPGDVDTIEQLCPLLEGHTDILVEFAITFMVAGIFAETPESVETLIECLLEAGVLVEGTLPPPPI